MPGPTPAALDESFKAMRDTEASAMVAIIAADGAIVRFSQVASPMLIAAMRICTKRKKAPFYNAAPAAAAPARRRRTAAAKS